MGIAGSGVLISEAIDFLVSQGHSWKDIQGYNVAQIALFYKAALKRAEREQRHELMLNWIASHASQKDIKEVIRRMARKATRARGRPVEEADPNKVRRDWLRLANTFRRLK